MKFSFKRLESRPLNEKTVQNREQKLGRQRERINTTNRLDINDFTFPGAPEAEQIHEKHTISNGNASPGPIDQQQIG